MSFYFPKRLVSAVVILLLTLSLSCRPTVSHEGTYIAGGEDASAESVIVLDLKENGKGCWQKKDEKVPFRWKVHKGSELRLHLKLGGIVLGKISDGTVEITLPGTEKLSFKKK